MSDFLCIFEDKKFSNFLPLSLSQPVFDLNIGGKNLRTRHSDELVMEKVGVLCRDYLADVFATKEPGIMVNELAAGKALFINGRLLCYGDDLTELLNRIPDNGLAVKGGYVVAAKLEAEAAEDFAGYIRRRIGAEAIDKLCDELKGYVSNSNSNDKKTGKSRKDSRRSEEAAEGSYEDDHALGQDSLAEKLPQSLLALIDKHNIARIDMPEARLVSFPWQIIEENPAAIEDDFRKSPFRGQSEESIVYPGVQMVAEENIIFGDSAVIRPGAVLDASSGPIIINDGTTVMPNACIIGPVYVGRNSIIKAGAKILEGTSVGDVCKVGGEVDQTIFAAYSNKQHDGFIGHSYLGEWVNIGAGSNNSDLKNNYSAVRMWCAGAIHETGRQFMGVIMGDHTKTGIGTVLNSGTVVGFNCNLYGTEIPPKFVPSFSWGAGENITDYVLEKAVFTAQVVMERREVRFGDVYRKYFEEIHSLSARCGRNI